MQQKDNWKETVLAQELSLAEERQTVKLQELSEAVDQAFAG